MEVADPVHFLVALGQQLFRPQVPVSAPIPLFPDIFGVQGLQPACAQLRSVWCLDPLHGCCI